MLAVSSQGRWRCWGWQFARRGRGALPGTSPGPTSWAGSASSSLALQVRRGGGVGVGGVTAVLSCAWPQLCRVAAAMSCVRSQCATAAASCVCSQPRCTTTVTSCVWSQPRCVLLQRVAYFLRCAELSVVSAGPGHTAVMSYVESQLCWALLGHQRVQPCLLSVEGPHGWGWHLGGRVPVPTSHPPPPPPTQGSSISVPLQRTCPQRALKQGEAEGFWDLHPTPPPPTVPIGVWLCGHCCTKLCMVTVG